MNSEDTISLLFDEKAYTKVYNSTIKHLSPVPAVVLSYIYGWYVTRRKENDVNKDGYFGLRLTRIQTDLNISEHIVRSSLDKLKVYDLLDTRITRKYNRNGTEFKINFQAWGALIRDQAPLKKKVLETEDDFYAQLNKNKCNWQSLMFGRSNLKDVVVQLLFGISCQMKMYGQSIVWTKKTVGRLVAWVKQQNYYTGEKEFDFSFLEEFIPPPLLDQGDDEDNTMKLLYHLFSHITASPERFRKRRFEEFKETLIG